MEKRFVVKIDIPDGYTPSDIRDYMRDAISNWSGQFHPDDPLFGWFHAQEDRLTIKFIPEDECEKENT
jgi:hypothetical protein